MAEGGAPASTGRCIGVSIRRFNAGAGMRIRCHPPARLPPQRHAADRRGASVVPWAERSSIQSITPRWVTFRCPSAATNRRQWHPSAPSTARASRGSPPKRPSRLDGAGGSMNFPNSIPRGAFEGGSLADFVTGPSPGLRPQCIIGGVRGCSPARSGHRGGDGNAESPRGRYPAGCGKPRVISRPRAGRIVEIPAMLFG